MKLARSSPTFQDVVTKLSQLRPEKPRCGFVFGASIRRIGKVVAIDSDDWNDSNKEIANMILAELFRGAIK